MTSFVYAFQLDNGIKIGKSDNPEERKSNFQTINTKEINTICLLETPDSYHYEEVIHKLLKKYQNNYRKEMFICPPELVISVFNSVRTIIQSLDKENNDTSNTVTNSDVSNIEDEKFMIHYNLSQKHIRTFHSLQESLYNNTIDMEDFKSFIQKKKLIYKSELYDIFKKYLLFSNNHLISNLDSNVYEFILIHLEYKKESRIHFMNIWDLYVSWCKKTGKQESNKSDFKIKIESFFNLTRKTFKMKSERRVGWSNIKLKIH
jgi:hypothetical protein